MSKLFIVFLFIYSFSTNLVLAQSYLSQVANAYKWKQEELIENIEIESFNPQYIIRKQRISFDLHKPKFATLLTSIEKKLPQLIIEELPLAENKKISKILTEFKNKATISEAIKQQLTNLAKSNDIDNHLVSLWLALIYYTENNLDLAQEFLNQAYLSASSEINLKRETLQSLLYLKKKQYGLIKIKIKNWDLYYPFSSVPRTLTLIDILSLGKNNLHQKMQQKIQLVKLNNKNDVATQYFLLLKCWNYYYIRQYDQAFALCKNISKKGFLKQEQLQITYFQLWLAFFTKNNKTYARLFKQLSKEKIIDFMKKELNYLSFIKQIQKKKLADLEPFKNSVFYTAAFVLLQAKNKLELKPKEFLISNLETRKNPEIVFFYQSQQAELLQEKGQLDKALQHYFKALSATLNFPFPKDEYFYAQTYFNIGIVYLKKNKFKKASAILSQFKNHKQLANLAKYHLSIIYYFQKKPKELLALKVSPPRQIYDDYIFLQAWANQQLGKVDLALKLSKKTKVPLVQALIFSIDYQNKQYDKIIKSYKGKTYDETKFYIYALLQNKKKKQALLHLQPQSKNSEYTNLYLRVLIANKLYNQVINYVDQQLKNNNPNERQLYVAAAFAYYQLNNWNESLLFIEKIILTNPSIQTENKAWHNVFLNLLYSPTKQHQQYLNKLIANETKNSFELWQKVIVLADYLEKKLKFKEALKVYRSYLDANTYQKASIQLLIQKNFYLQSYFDLCQEYGKSAFYQETDEQLIDRQLTLGYCDLYTKEQSQKDLKITNSEYRIASWALLKLLEKKTLDVPDPLQKQKEQLNIFERQKYSLYRAQYSLNQGELAKAEAILNEADNYILQPEHYQEMLLLKIQIYLAKGENKEALNYLTKLIYNPFIESKTRGVLILKATELLLELNWYEEANRIFITINKNQLPQNLQEQYGKIYQQLL